MLFDLYLMLQHARLNEQPSAKQSKLIRYSIRRLRESLVAEQTTKPETSEVSRNLALSLLLNSDDHEPF
jgi:hypothetical protein